MGEKVINEEQIEEAPEEGNMEVVESEEAAGNPPPAAESKESGAAAPLQGVAEEANIDETKQEKPAATCCDKPEEIIEQESLSEADIEHIAQGVVDRSITGLRTTVADLGEAARSDSQRLLGIPGQIDVTLKRFLSAILERIEDPNGRYVQNMQKNLLKGIVGIYDLVRELERNADKVTSSEEYRANYRTLAGQIIQLLAFNDVEPITPESGTKMDAKYYRGVDVVHTPNPEEDDLVESRVRDGFTWGQFVFRPAEVILKKYSADLESAEIAKSEENPI